MTKITNRTSTLPLPPGSYGLPFIGETIAWRRNPLEFLRRRYERYGRIFRTSTYGYPEIAMLGPEANKFILSSHYKHFEWGGGQSRIFDKRLFGRNIFVLDGEAHDHQRRFIVPAFHGKALKSYFDVIYQLAQTYASRWAQVGQITAFTELRNLTFETAARLLLGAETGDQTLRLSKLFDDLGKGVQGILRWDVRWTRFGRALRAVESLKNYFRALLQQRRNNPRHDALGMLMVTTDEEGKHLTEEEIISHLITLVAAAHDTSTSTLTWLLYELGRNPEVTKRLRSELTGVTNGSPLNVESISHLRYLDLVLKEVERMHPAVTGAPRMVVKAFDFHGYHVPAGSIVYYSILFTHMMPDIFTDPECFDPDRFAHPRTEDERTPFSLIGFGGGTRSCIGQGFARTEIKIVTATLLKDYEWTVLPGQNLSARYSLTKRPKDGLRIMFSSRKSSS